MYQRWDDQQGDIARRESLGARRRVARGKTSAYGWVVGKCRQPTTRGLASDEMEKRMKKMLVVLTALVLVSCGTPQKKGLKLSATSHSVTLAWTQGVVPSGSPAVSGNNVYRGTTSGGEALLTSLSTPATSYVDTAVTAGTTYYYEVTAVNSSGESGKSNEAVATVPNPQVPGAPILGNPTVVSTTAPCVPSGYQAWTSIAIPAQSGNFEIQMDAKPGAADMNAVIMLGSVAATSYSQDYVYLRFWTTGSHPGDSTVRTTGQ